MIEQGNLEAEIMKQIKNYLDSRSPNSEKQHRDDYITGFNDAIGLVVRLFELE